MMEPAVMGPVLYLLPVVVPIVFWVVYHLYHDRALPEPTFHLVLAFLLGVGSFYLGLGAYEALGWLGLRHDAFALGRESLPRLMAYAVLAIGPIEEAVKILPFVLVVLRFREFDQPIDGIIYASFIALGFAAVENLRYLPSLSGFEAFARGFAGPVVHMTFATVWGYFIGRDWLCGRSIVRTTVTAFVATALLHGLYDFLALAWPAWTLPAAAVLVTTLWLWRVFLIRDLNRLPPGRCPDDETG